ncbi:hypothetical protein L486_02429 [Kwoniella mangroviensis CBS 10435]|uniref:Uncharacterized protein n=1 Tax=Kwoniella mangroviensis CBS 10435 TaxID=1331196 RepID=A0A1B9IW63_9TREE|nr:hypothetical protein L486_02429 [Kwoniella mangroviensis CBS 10435]
MSVAYLRVYTGRNPNGSNITVQRSRDSGGRGRLDSTSEIRDTDASRYGSESKAPAVPSGATQLKEYFKDESGSNGETKHVRDPRTKALAWITLAELVRLIDPGQTQARTGTTYGSELKTPGSCEESHPGSLAFSHSPAGTIVQEVTGDTARPLEDNGWQIVSSSDTTE